MRITILGVVRFNGEIAKALSVAENTVQNHGSRILEKAGCANRTGLARLIVQQTSRQHFMGTKVL